MLIQVPNGQGGTKVIEVFAYLATIHFIDLDKELNGFKIGELRTVAHTLSIPSRYPDTSRKPKNVLVAAISEDLRQQRLQTEGNPPDQISVRNLRSFLFDLREQGMTVGELRQRLFKIENQHLGSLAEIVKIVNGQI